MRRITAFLLALILLLPVGCVSADAQEIRGVWVGSVANLDFPSQKGLTEAQLRAELESIVTNCRLKEINTIFFQVRPNSDALYASDIFPWSEVLSGEQGKAADGGFDPLAYITEIAHQNNIELHAWINPYRIGDISKAADSNPAKLHPEYTVTCSDGNTYYNPALPQVRGLVLGGVKEIIENYDVDGIHFDDYFYPYDVEDFDDKAAFEQYGKDFADIGDFRRNNVNLLVKSVKELIDSSNKDISFGISPFGIWANSRDVEGGSETFGMSSYLEIYADSKYWVEQKLVDYICPQIYWSFENTAAPFDKVLRWWNELCSKNNTDLYVGIALYKQGTDEVGFQDPDQITRQLELCDESSAVKGTVYFRYGSLIEPVKYDAEYKPTTAVTSSAVKITGPANNYKTTEKYCSVTGVADPSKPLLLGDKTVNMTEHGYFCEYVELSPGTNNFTFVNGDSKSSVTIRRISKQTASENGQIYDAFPSGKCRFFSGESVTLSVRAPKDSEVFALANGERLEMSPEGDGTVYKTVLNMPSVYSQDAYTCTVEYTALIGGKEYPCEQKAEISLLTKAYTMYTACESYVYDGAQGGSMMDNYQYPKGTAVTVNGEADGMSRLTTGKWITAENLTADQPSQIIDIDTSKYTESVFTFKKEYSYSCDVTESGKLLLELYHAPCDYPKIKEGSGISVKYTRNTTRTKAIVSLRGKKITGYYMTENDDGTLSLWIYNGQSGGLSGKTIVIDAGHGGEDCGAAGPPGESGVCEAELNLSIAFLLKQRLESKGAKVYLTRDEDETLLLSERAELIRSYCPDICISVHGNSVARESDFNKASGLLTLYSRNTSAPLSDILSKNLANGTGIASEGTRMQSLNVCRDYRYPCVLLECGYVCNPSEYETLLNDSFKTALCNNIVVALSDYFG